MIDDSRHVFYRNLRWWYFYISIYVVIHVCLSSIGAFFHFLLDHEISIVEGWLHKNGWELAIVSKLLAFYVFHKTLLVRLYKPRTLFEFLKQEWRPPSYRLLVCIVFMFISLVIFAGVEKQPQNYSFFWYQFVTYICLVTWYLIDYYVIAQLKDLFEFENVKFQYWLVCHFCIGFFISFKMIIPDYFGVGAVSFLHFIFILMITGVKLQQWSNAFFYLVLFAAPIASLLGLDPIWGQDFTPFKMKGKLQSTFLLILWMISLAYYRYRHRWRWPFVAS
jgi:hypothetical protein